MHGKSLGQQLSWAYLWGTLIHLTTILVYLSTNRMTMVRGDIKFDEEKAMRCSLQRELQLHAVEELLAPKEEPQDDVEQPHAKEQRVEITTHVNNSRDGRKHTREANTLMYDVRDNVGEPTSQRNQSRSPDRYTGYMDMMSESVEIELFSFEEEV